MLSEWGTSSLMQIKVISLNNTECFCPVITVPGYHALWMGQVLPYADLLQAVDLQGHEGHVVPGQLPVQHPLKGQLRNSSDPFARLSSSERTPLIWHLLYLPNTWASSENESLKIIRNRVEFIINLKPFLSMNCPQSLNVIVFLAHLVLCIILYNAQSPLRSARCPTMLKWN